MDICNATKPGLLSKLPERPVEAIIGMLSFFSFLGTTGNALVLYVYVRKRNKLASTIFIISLAATDFMTCVCVMPYTITVEYLNYKIKYDILCKLYLFLITCNVPFSAFIMVAIAVDRYLCICHPHWHVLDARRSKLIIVSLAFFAVVLGLVTALAYGVYALKPQSFNGLSNVSFVNERCSNDTGSWNCTLPPEVVSKLCQKNIQPNEFVTTYTGDCRPNELIFTRTFRKTYQKVYACMFLVAFVVVFILYILIYKSVHERRSRRLKQKRKSKMSLQRETSMTETASVANGSPNHESKRAMLDKNGCIREKYWLANIRTALMLFVVTVVFIIAFLPSWLMAHRVVDFKPIVFYLYFAYNVSNPIIYAFMNPAFRRELRDVFSCRKCMNHNC